MATRSPARRVPYAVVVAVAAALLACVATPAAATTVHLIEAAEQGDQGAVQAFLDGGTDCYCTDDPDSAKPVASCRACTLADRNDDGHSALTAAARGGHAEVVKALLAAGAPLGAPEYDGNHALTHAADNGHAEVMVALLEAAGGSGGGGGGAMASRRSSAGHTPLHGAAHSGCARCVALLLEAGANVDGDGPVTEGMAEAGEEPEANTPLIIAAKRGHNDVVAMLIKAGAELDARGNEGWTAIKFASWFGHGRVVQLLAAAGADPNLATDEGDTALQLATKRMHVDIAETLVEAGADTHRVLMGAALSGNVGTVQIVLAAGADEDSVQRAVMDSARRGHHSAVRTLVDGGAVPAPAGPERAGRHLSGEEGELDEEVDVVPGEEGHAGRAYHGHTVDEEDNLAAASARSPTSEVQVVAHIVAHVHDGDSHMQRDECEEAAIVFERAGAEAAEAGLTDLALEARWKLFCARNCIEPIPLPSVAASHGDDNAASCGREELKAVDGHGLMEDTLMIAAGRWRRVHHWNKWYALFGLSGASECTMHKLLAGYRALMNRLSGELETEECQDTMNLVIQAGKHLISKHTDCGSSGGFEL